MTVKQQKRLCAAPSNTSEASFAKIITCFMFKDTKKECSGSFNRSDKIGLIGVNKANIDVKDTPPIKGVARLPWLLQV